MTKSQRRKVHAAINQLTHEELRAVVKQVFPDARGKRVDVIAKQIVAAAHEEVSPRK